ncbi:MAG: hypothetical protein K6B65_05790 [Bacilli bacterium]|nr:hypothetical protein [Bacilli bacterium]
MDRLNFSKFALSDQERLEKESLEALKNDPEVYSYIQNELGATIGEVKANLAVLLDYQEDYHYCKNCPGFDACEKAQPHYVMSLEKDGPFLKREFSACPLASKKQMYKARFLRQDFPDEWQDKSPNDIDRSGNRRDLLGEFYKIMKGKSSRWIYIQGGPRSGKSFILACFANFFAESNPPVAYCDSPLFIDTLKNVAFSKERHAKEAQAKLIDTYSRCPLLVLDGFGNEFKSEYVYASLLYPILSARSKNGLPTFFASDFLIDEVIGDYENKIGKLRATQFSRFLKTMCVKEYVLSELNGIY